ncbi:MAG: amidohydrolase [Desulfovibrionaceae bacterium]|nr:amidohydrolase [Desulfovibrionaceae bacterium]
MSESVPAPTPESVRSCDLLLSARHVVTQDAERRVLDHAAVAVAGGRVAAAGPRAEVAAAWRAARTLDLGESILLPGLVNAHTHAPMALLRGLSDDLPLQRWLTEHVFPVEQHHTPDSVRAGAMLACAEMLRTGCTCYADMHFFSAQSAEAAVATGIRAVPGEAVFGFPTPAYADPEAALDAARAAHERFRGHPRIRPALAPHAEYTTTPEMLQKSFALAEELDVPWLFHLAETRRETGDCLARRGMRPTAYLDSLGLLGPRACLAHCVDISEAEVRLLAERGARVAHCPESNMKLASGVAPVPALLAAGGVVGLGTDGPASNNNLNLFGEMASASLVHKAVSLDPTTLDAQTALDLATRGSAACVGWPELGRIEVGGPADLCALDLNVPWMQPCYNPVSQVVYAATGAEVRCTVVAGEVVWLDGKFTTFDYPALLRELENWAKWVLEKV